MDLSDSALLWNLIRQNSNLLPERYYLCPAHAKELAESLILPEHALKNGICSVTAEEAFRATGHAHAGMLFPYFDRHGKLCKYVDKESGQQKIFCRLKPDKKVGDAKYLSPKNAPVFYYYPRTNELNWLKIPKEIVLTEGEKKALAMAIMGMHCIGLGGVSSYCTGERNPETGKRSLGDLVDDINILACERVTVIYDADIVEKWPVQTAINSFAKNIWNAYSGKLRDESKRNGDTGPRAKAEIEIKMRLLSSILRYSLLPVVKGVKVGLDDALILFGVDAVKELITAGLPLIDVTTLKGDMIPKFVFKPEPSGDEGSNLNKAGQRYLRSVLGTLALKNSFMRVKGLSYFEYNPAKDIWEGIDPETWASLPEKASDIYGWKNRSQSVQVELMRMFSNRSEMHSDLIDSAELLGFQNGTMVVSTGELRPSQRTDYLTQRLGFDYDPDATCDKFINWISWVFNNNADLINILRALFKWSLVPKPDAPFQAQVWPIALGAPGTGKSTLLNVLCALCGSSVGSYTYTTIKEETARFDMRGKLITVNLDQKGFADESTFEAMNQIACNDPVPIRCRFAQSSTVRLGTTPWAAANKPVQTSIKDSAGLSRRIIYLPFNRKPESVDPNLFTTLTSELAGIFNWVWSMPLDEAVKTISIYTRTETYVDEQIELLAEQNSVVRWLMDPGEQMIACTPEDIQNQVIKDLKGERIPVSAEGRWTVPSGPKIVSVPRSHRIPSELHRQYANWCELNGERPVGPNVFSGVLASMGIERTKVGGHRFFVMPDPRDLNFRKALG